MTRTLPSSFVPLLNPGREVHPGRWPGSLRAAVLGLPLALVASFACAPRARAEGTIAPSAAQAAPAPRPAEAPAPPGKEATPPARGDGATTTEPLTQQRVAPALDPEPGGGRCAGYTFDGVSLDMTRKILEAAVPLVPLSRADSMIEGFEERTFGFRAARPGRLDDVQVGFSLGESPAVMHIHASIFVAEDDAWPRTLFDRLGKPRNARIGEWIWWDMSCAATLRLVKIEALGGGSGHAYTLDVRHTLKPAE